MIPIKKQPIQAAFDSSFDDVRMDASTHSLQTIDYAHHEIHSGSMFSAHVSQTTSNADDKQTIISFKTKAGTKYLHIFPVSATSGQSWFYIYENPTIVASGGTSAVVVYNRRRTSTKNSTVLDSDSTSAQADYWDESDAAGANITLGDGTLIHSELLGAGRQSYAQSRAEAEWVLKADTNYAFVLENEGASANTHNIILEFYEHTDRD